MGPRSSLFPVWTEIRTRKRKFHDEEETEARAADGVCIHAGAHFLAQRGSVVAVQRETPDEGARSGRAGKPRGQLPVHALCVSTYSRTLKQNHTHITLDAIGLFFLLDRFVVTAHTFGSCSYWRKTPESHLKSGVVCPADVTWGPLLVLVVGYIAIPAITNISEYNRSFCSRRICASPHAYPGSK